MRSLYATPITQRPLSRFHEATLDYTIDPMTVILRAYSILLPPHARETPAAVGSTMALMTAGLPLSNAR